MYCLSRDGSRATEANGFGIVRTESVIRYYRAGEYKFNTQGKALYCIYTNTGYFMDAFYTEEEAKAKLKEAMTAAASGVEIFEF